MKTSLLKNKDFLGGLFLIAIGAAAAFISSGYPMGTPRQMGPGFLPMALAGLLALCGLVLAIRAPQTTDKVQGGGLRPVLIVLGGVLVFSWALEPLGLIPASLILVLISCTAHTPFRLGESLALSAGLTLGVVVLFAYALSIPFGLWPWSA